MKESESEVLKIEESESKFLKIEESESESELLCSDSTALLEIHVIYIFRLQVNLLYFFETRCVVYVLFATTCCLFHNVIPFGVDNIHVCHTACAKI
jgi:hypothetical protein